MPGATVQQGCPLLPLRIHASNLGGWSKARTVRAKQGQGTVSKAREETRRRGNGPCSRRTLRCRAQASGDPNFLERQVFRKTGERTECLEQTQPCGAPEPMQQRLASTNRHLDSA